MDLWSVYRQVGNEQFPGRMIVADRFHVVRMANESIERLRKAIRKSLDNKTRLKLKDDRFILLSRRHNLSEYELEKLEYWTKLFPALGAAYDVKEAFHNIYMHSSKVDAMKAAEEWKQSIDPAVDWAFREAKGELCSWWNEIFNFYDLPTSDAYTESIKNMAKGMNRMGRGYIFEVIRARLLYDKKARGASTGIIRKRVNKPAISFGLAGYQMDISMSHKIVNEAIKIEYGAHLPTLAKLLDEGYFI